MESLSDSESEHTRQSEQLHQEETESATESAATELANQEMAVDNEPTSEKKKASPVKKSKAVPDSVWQNPDVDVKLNRGRKCLTCGNEKFDPSEFKYNRLFKFTYHAPCGRIIQFRRPTYSLKRTKNLEAYLKTKNNGKKNEYIGIYKGNPNNAAKKAATRLWREMRKQNVEDPNFALQLRRRRFSIYKPAYLKSTSADADKNLVDDDDDLGTKKAKKNSLVHNVNDYMKYSDHKTAIANLVQKKYDNQIFSYKIAMKPQDQDSYSKMVNNDKLKAIVENRTIYVADVEGITSEEEITDLGLDPLPPISKCVIIKGKGLLPKGSNKKKKQSTGAKASVAGVKSGRVAKNDKKAKTAGAAKKAKILAQTKKEKLASKKAVSKSAVKAKQPSKNGASGKKLAGKKQPKNKEVKAKDLGEEVGDNLIVVEDAM